ncbi:MAG: urease accessory protein UreD [Polyangiaceae bacterium]
MELASAVVRARGAESEIHRARSAGALRLMFPRTSPTAAWVVTSNLGGGLVRGDAQRLELDVGAEARCLLTTQGSTKVYRGSSRFELAARIGSGGALLAVPDPISLYRGARLEQRTELTLEPDANLLFVEVFTAGRVAHGERWDLAGLDARLVLKTPDRTFFRDRLLLDPAHGGVAERMRSFDALGTVVALGPAFTELTANWLADRTPARADRGRGLQGPVLASSPVAGGAIVRLASPTISQAIDATRALASAACAVFDEDPFARKG